MAGSGVGAGSLEMTFKSGSGTLAWTGLATYVFVWDFYALTQNKETLTRAFERAIEHPVARWPVALLWGVTTLHLFRLIPKKYDPFHVITKWVGQTFNIGGTS